MKIYTIRQTETEYFMFLRPFRFFPPFVIYKLYKPPTKAENFIVAVPPLENFVI